jgi:phenylacetate-CoA ligase
VSLCNSSGYIHLTIALYRDLPSHIVNLEDLPLTDNDKYWEASNGETNEVLTTPFIDGVVLRSGGSSNIPKTVLMTRAEFHLTAQINSVMMAEANELVPGDRVANLAVQGGLYSGFMTYGYAIMNCPIPLVNLPISGNEPLESITRSIIEFKATVIICTVYNSTRLAEHLQREKVILPDVRRILFSGEAFYKDLRDIHLAVFPNAKIRPVGYGSVELKIFGFPVDYPGDEEDADVDPIYKVKKTSVIMEIIDSNGSVIRENGKRGVVVGTNLIMRL